LQGQRNPNSELIGVSHCMQRVHDEIRSAASNRLPVLIQGDSGVGKELVAQAIHALSESGPFVPVNCAALPEGLVESELFGHARGAFTNAGAESGGLFGAAAGGTLFLDEIGEMPLSLQAKLLRALASGEVRGVGQHKPRQIDLKVVAATNVDLAAAVEAGSFRGDLFARLRASIVRVSPLHERRDDILPLLRHFLRSGLALSADAAEALLIHDWPWNVRELAQLVATLAPAIRAQAQLDLAALPAALQRPFDARRGRAQPDASWLALLDIRRTATPSRDELCRVLEHFGGNVSRVAAFFGRERRQVYRWAEQQSIPLVGARPATMPPPSEGDGE
jgi:DNA-binding NtrC family response regulator